MNVYKDNPQPGEWHVVLNWLQPVSGSEISEPFSGSGHSSTRSGRTRTCRIAERRCSRGKLHVRRESHEYGPVARVVLPRPEDHENATIQLPDENGSDQNMTLPSAAGIPFPFYVVPPDTTKIQASLTGSAPVTYDLIPSQAIRICRRHYRPRGRGLTVRQFREPHLLGSRW